MDRLYYSEDFSFHQVHQVQNKSTPTPVKAKPKTQRKSIKRSVSHAPSHRPSKKVKRNTRSPSLPLSAECVAIKKLPLELNELILKTTAKSMLLPRIVEIHEEKLEIRFKYADDETSCPPERRIIKHLRSVTRSPTLLLQSREYKAKFTKRFFDKNTLKHELCPDSIPFNFNFDSAYFTLDTLKSWMSLWGKCSQIHPNFPLNNEDEAGVVLRKHLRRIVLDVKLIIGGDPFSLPDGSEFRGNEINVEEFALGLAAFPSLETITLVVAEQDAEVHMEYFNSNEDTPFEESVYMTKELRADKGLESIELTKPQDNTNSAVILEAFAVYLRGGLQYYWNEYERPGNLGSYRPGIQRQIRILPTVKTMVRNT